MTIPTIIADIEKALEKATPGIWQPCHHLKSPEHDQSCSCGYRGGIWSGDGQHLVVEMGSSPDRDENGSVIGHMMPQADRPTQLADAAYIIATSPGNIRALLTALSEEKARAERAEAERDCAIQAMSGEASARGFAEGKLQASAWPGIIDGWKTRAEAADARLLKAIEIICLCQSSIAMMIAPDAIKQTTVINAYAGAVEAEAKCRRFLENTNADK